MRAKNLKAVIEMCGVDTFVDYCIYVDSHEHRVFLLDASATGGEQKVQLMNNIMPRRYVTKRGVLLRRVTRNYLSGYITTAGVSHMKKSITIAQIPQFLNTKVGQIAARDAMKMCKEVYLSVRPCKRGMWAVSMYYAAAYTLYNITNYADIALQFPAMRGGRVIVDNVGSFVMRLKRAGINAHIIGDFKCQT